MNEQETHIIYDYERDQVRIFTTKESVIKQILNKLSAKGITVACSTDGYGYSVTVPITECGNPGNVIKKLSTATGEALAKYRQSLQPNTSPISEATALEDDSYVDMNIS